MTQISVHSPREIDDDLRWFLLRRRTQETRIRRAFEIFRRAGIEPILIKGWAAANNYPEPAKRISGDIDLAVAAADFSAAQKLLEYDETKALNIDLHCELRRLDTVPWQDLFENSIVTDLDGIRIRTLRAEDHLRVLCVHWLIDGGARKDKLWDIYYAVENRPADFDWTRCFGPVSQIRQGWIGCAIGLAHKYLALFIDDLPFANQARNIPLWVSRAVEREWKSNVRITGPERFLKNPILLIQQIRKRIPPNPIQASIEMEQAMDERSRIPIQIGSIFRKLIPSTMRVAHAITRKTWKAVDE